MGQPRKPLDARVTIIGWAPELPAPAHTRDVISVREFLVNGLLPRDVLVLGDGALAKLRPDAVRARVGLTGETVVLVPVRCDPCSVARWGEALLGPAVSPEELEGTLERMGASPVRLTLSAWCGAAGIDASEDALQLLALVPTLNRLRASDWCRALDCSRDALLRRCRSHLGRTPRSLLWSYVTANVERLRGRRWSYERIAEVLGYADGSSLARAIRSRRDWVASLQTVSNRLPPALDTGRDPPQRCFVPNSRTPDDRTAHERAGWQPQRACAADSSTRAGTRSR